MLKQLYLPAFMEPVFIGLLDTDQCAVSFFNTIICMKHRMHFGFYSSLETVIRSLHAVSLLKKNFPLGGYNV